MSTWEFIGTYWPDYLSGLGNGLVMALGAMAISLVVGTIGALGRLSHNKLARALAACYVAVFRGIPPLVMLFIVYFGLPEIAHGSGPVFEGLLSPLNNRVIAAIVALGISSGAYSTEIIRAGIAGVPHEQTESARSLGMSKRLALRRVVLPQAARLAFPALGNEFIINLKGTSLASVIGAVELMRAAQLASSTTFKTMLAFSLAGLFYVVVVVVLQIALSVVDKKLTPSSTKGPRRRTGSRHQIDALQQH